LLHIVAFHVDASPHLEFYLIWAQVSRRCQSSRLKIVWSLFAQHLLSIHGAFLKKSSSKLLTTFRALQKTLTRQHKDLSKMCVRVRQPVSDR
jgi:hypothetical protein